MSGVGLNKLFSKKLVAASGVKVTDCIFFSKDQWEFEPDAILEKIEKEIHYPCFVKPNAKGSAIGISRSLTKQELIESIQKALRWDTDILVEKEIVGIEIEVAFTGTPYQPSVTQPGSIETPEFYDYETKYGQNSPAELSIPAHIPEEAIQEVRSLAITVVKALRLEGLSRIDFWYDPKKEEFTFNEVNTLPGLTSISMFPRLMEYSGIHPKTWIQQLFEDAKDRMKNQQKLKVAYPYDF